MKNRRRGKDTDELFRETFKRLTVDSSIAWNGENVFRKVGLMSTAEKREYVFPSKFCWNDAYKLKWHYQLESFLQRYRFRDEPLSEVELKNKTFDKFKNNLERLRNLTYGEALCSRVIKKARGYISSILNLYDEEEVMSSCRFGTKSTVGNPYSEAYLDLKLKGPISGSWAQLYWFFDTYLPTDPLLAEAVCKGDVQIVERLSVALVPKSYKIMRPILANTFVGNFHSYGLGVVIANRLRDAGLDINKLQEKHRRLVDTYSRSRSHVTADLSAASDSITHSLAAMLLPIRWYEACCIDSFHTIDVNGEVLDNPCFCTMGIGYTFPLETLIFYALLKAIEELAGNARGRISVYGDDLIYHRSMHAFVATIFPLLGFILNMEKTYVLEYFRESCGADFYHGIDVRPYRPLASSSYLGRNKYGELVIKLINGLLLRWDPSEIGVTLHYLYREVANSFGFIPVVPPSLPDTAGVKCSSPFVAERTGAFARPKWIHSPRLIRKKICILSSYENGWWSFPSVGQNNRYREISDAVPYYWDKLRQISKDVTPSIYDSVREMIVWRSLQVDAIEVKTPCVAVKDSAQPVLVTTCRPTWA